MTAWIQLMAQGRLSRLGPGILVQRTCQSPQSLSQSSPQSLGHPLETAACCQISYLRCLHAPVLIVPADPLDLFRTRKSSRDGLRPGGQKRRAACQKRAMRAATDSRGLHALVRARRRLKSSSDSSAGGDRYRSQLGPATIDDLPGSSAATTLTGACRLGKSGAG